METHREVGAYEAKVKLGALLDEVAKGRSVTITRHGAPVAVMVPADRAMAANPAEVAASLRAFRMGRTLGADVRDLIAEGRR
ncbi:MAG: type II toxin-antitoxin system Phd/YefM family antitoxin [Magnetospirillum sp.]|nr:type II toxin-antitoxin system Phd/YefM family antitoxin [Magnetospirillum sp.]